MLNLWRLPLRDATRRSDDVLRPERASRELTTEELNKLSRLLELPEADREALQAAARSAVNARWSWEQVSTRLLQPFTN